MKSVLRSLIFSLLISGCRGSSGCVLGKKELRFEIENIWWELLETPFIDNEEGRVCVLFDSEKEMNNKADGEVRYYTELSGFDEYLSDFKRNRDGFHLVDYNTDIIIFVDGEGNYSAELETGFFLYNKTIPFAPCDFEP